MSSINIISVEKLARLIGTPKCPDLIDVRTDEDFARSPHLLPGAIRRPYTDVAGWAGGLRAGSAIVICQQGRKLSEGTAALLRVAGIAAESLEGGFEAWQQAALPLVPVGKLPPRNAKGATLWVTRERPKIDRIACPWLIARFVDAEAQFLYVPTPQVLSAAREKEAIPYDIPDVHFSHDGERCSFDAFVMHYRLRDPALAQLALIVRGADTAHLELAPQAAGLAAISLGLSRNFANDHAMLAHGMVVYDALYRWCKEGRDEMHTWNPQAYETRVAEAA